VFVVVQKFGGTSVANIERLKRVAEIIACERNKGSQVIAVVSAMSGVTDQLINYTKSISELSLQHELAEYDAVVSSGEQVTAALLALALQAIDIRSRSFLGWQLPIVTDGAHSNSRIISIGTTQLIESLTKGEVPVISGFQGVFNERITTLGRGGSDTTAVAIAAAVCANRCDIFTDVEGVFSADPRIIKKAKKIETITYKQMLTMATAGAKVMHPRAVDISLSHNLKTQILSSFSDAPGTILVKDNKGLERGSVLAVVSNGNVAIIKILNLSNDNDIIKKIFNYLNELAVSVQFICSSNQNNLNLNATLIISKDDVSIISCVLQKFYLNFTVNEDIARITVVSNGSGEKLMMLQKVFQILSNSDINAMSVDAIDTNISIIVKSEYKDATTIGLHSGFGLDTF